MLLSPSFQLVVILAFFWLGKLYSTSVADTSADTSEDRPHEVVVATNGKQAAELAMGKLEQWTYQLQDQIHTIQLEAEGIRKEFYLAQAQKHKELASLYTQLATQQAQVVDAMGSMVENVGALKTASAKTKDLQEKMRKALCHVTPPLGHVFQVAYPEHQYNLEEADTACREHGGRLAEYSELLKLQRMDSGPHYCAWVEGGTAYYPEWEETASCHGNKCIRIKTCDKGDTHNVWCFKPLGICPPFTKKLLR